MPDSYWFSSTLIDSGGRWRGRFLRSVPSAAGRDAPIAIFLQEADDFPPADLTFLPAAACPDPAPDAVLAWGHATDAATLPCVSLRNPDDYDATASRYVALSAADDPPFIRPGSGIRTLLILDTGMEPGWAFPPGAGGALADVGHLAHRRPAPGAEKERSKPQLLSLLALITRDADTKELEKVFRSDPELAYHLLRLVNSVGMGLTHQVKSLSHAITVVGRRQLQRWLQLLIYVNPAAGRDQPNPLLQLAAYRGRLLELLASPGRDPDSAYIVGIFSLLDRILPQKMAEIIAKLPIQPEIRDALCNRGGYLGALLSAVEAAETGRLEAAAIALPEIDIDPQKWMRSQVTAYSFAHAIGRELTRPHP